MGVYGPDVRLAIELLETWKVDWWGWLASGLAQPVPRVTDRNMLELEGFQAWSASHAGPARSMVQSAISNIGRVVDDINAVLGYDLEFRDNVQFARRWYRDHDGAKRLADVDQWEVHVCLLQNLAVELIRAVNLLITRVRECGQGALQEQALALIEIGPDHALMQAPAYSEEESRLAEPYPGLRDFPLRSTSGCMAPLGSAAMTVRERLRNTTFGSRRSRLVLAEVRHHHQRT